ncbi:MAG TPA: hypothetical protein VEB66_01445 [Opitutaceae bacterium]|nr:hypothetical protein [Opitutaceae bacterium]
MPTPPHPLRRRLGRASLLAALLSCAPGAGPAAEPDRGVLKLAEEPGVYTVEFSGRGGYLGIPSWKAVVRRDDAGNISALHVPADHPRPLGSRTGQWPLTIVMSKNSLGVEGTMTKGRENYARFPVERFELREHAPERIVIAVGGPSPNRHYTHERTYTFTPAGVQIEGSLTALIDLSSIAFDPHFDRTQIADSHGAFTPMRTQGRGGWVYCGSSGRDGATALPEGVDYPLEAQLRLRRTQPIFLKLFYDQPFAAAAARRQIIHNNKDGWEAKADKVIFEKLVGFAGFPVPAGTTERFKVRFEFEIQPWE